jgi:hypothetical protein
MNTEAQIITKLVYIKSSCNALNDGTNEAAPSLMWITAHCDELIQGIFNSGGRKAHSWIRVADRCIEYVSTLKDEIEFDDDSLIPMDEGALHTASVVTHIADDLTRLKTGKRFDDLCLAAYSLETVLALPKRRQIREDVIRGYAGTYLEKLYKKISEC